MGLNEFADMDEAEMVQGIKFNEDLTAEFSTGRNTLLDASNVPSQVDWRPTGHVSPVKNQGTCGSCWAFSTVSALESAFSIHDKTSQTKSLSVQYLVDCDTSNTGC